MADLIEKATRAQAECLEKIHSSDEEKSKRPLFHLASPCGWINDPNGLSFYKGQLHLFFQYHPYSNKWGPMHWGHAASKDLLTWDFLPVAMAPDSDADIDGCFSGTAMEDDGKHVIVYTGVIKGNTVQNQCVAIGDGLKYKKLEGNPVITSKNIPFEYDIAHFRDPKVWKEDDFYYVAAVIKTNDKSGALVIFKSKDLKEWNFVSVAARSECKLGMMWECPDFFSFDENDVIVISPQEMKDDLEAGWHDGNNSVFMTGMMDRREWKFDRNSGAFEIQIAADETFNCKITVDFEKCEMSFDRSKSGTRTDCETFRKFRFEMPADGNFDLRLVCDTSSAELFACGGRYAFTNVFYTPLSAEGIKFTSSKSLSFDYNFYTLV